eukprot:TRINITY_DN3469_c0_g1_i1.p1 TRINITY_DN3469_c0_g1~~TRINITY_DN3469_c0_g1_i1.p1  ORF type:complete len:757 (-),score=113.05 TRINITY_DN3469_c0_g1_i1:39-2195(-)
MINSSGNDEQEIVFIEQRLQELAKRTLQFLSQVADYIRDYDRKRMSMKVKGYMTEQQREELRKETDDMKDKVDKLKLLYKASKQRGDELEGRCTDNFKRIREVENELENVQQELLGARRKLAKHKVDGQENPSTSLNSSQEGEDGSINSIEIQELGKIIQDKIQGKVNELTEQQNLLYQTERQIEDIDEKIRIEMEIEEKQELKDLHEKVKEVQLERETLNNQVLQFQRETATVQHQGHSHRLKVEEVELLKSEAEHIREWCRKKEEEVREERNRIWEMSGEVRALREASNDERSAAHWKKMYTTLESQIKLANEKLQRMEDRQEKVKEAENHWMQSECEAEKERMEQERIRSRLEESNVRLSTLVGRKRKLENRVRELKAFASVTVQLGGVDAGKATYARTQAAQQMQLRNLQSQEDGSDIAVRKREVEAREQNINREIKVLEQESSGYKAEAEKLKKEIEAMNAQLVESRNECDCFLNELEVTVKGYEGTISENKELCKQLETKEEEINNLKAERDKVNHEKKELEIELKNIQQETQNAEEERSQIQEQSLKLKNATQSQQQDLAECTKKIQSLEEEIQGVRNECIEVETKIKQKDEEISSLKQELYQLDEVMQQEEASLAQERILNIKVQEENNVLRRALGNNAALLVSGRSAGELFKQLRCSVCNIREKDTLITRCFHTFCRQCLNSLGDNRQRRCPRCNVVFLTSELRAFELD